MAENFSKIGCTIIANSQGTSTWFSARATATGLTGKTIFCLFVCFLPFLGLVELIEINNIGRSVTQHCVIFQTWHVVAALFKR